MKIMKKNIKSIIPLGFTIMMLGLIVSSCSSDETQTVTNFEQLIMQDEFNIDGTPDNGLWNYDIGRGQNGWGNNELQYYTERPENIVAEDGVLRITAMQ